MAGAKHGPLRLRGGKLWSAWRGWGVVEDFLEEAELEIGRKKKAFQWRPLYCPFPGAVQAASCHGAGGPFVWGKSERANHAELLRRSAASPESIQPQFWKGHAVNPHVVR